MLSVFDLNTSGKGSRHEAEARMMLIDREYELCWKTFRARFMDLDMFGIFDVVGRRKLSYSFGCTPIIRNVQVKTNMSFSRVKTEIHRKGNHGISLYEFAREYMLSNESCEVWVRWNPRWRGRGKLRYFEKTKWVIYSITRAGAIIEMVEK